MYIPGFGDVSTPAALRETLARNPGTAATERARSGRLGPLAREGFPGFKSALEGLGSTGPQVTDEGAGGSTGSRNDGGPYSTTLPPLTPEQLAAVEARRRAANRALAEAETMAEDRRMAAELENIGRLAGIQEQAGRQRRTGMQELAARGVARSPMFANPFRRELARATQEQIGLSQQTLAQTLDQLNVALNAARQRREQELAQIAFDTAMARSDVSRLLGV